jgi:hypothetical protein
VVPVKKFLVIVGILLACLVVVGLATYRHFVEPRHGGKPLSAWCHMIKTNAEAGPALRAIGGRARYWMLAWAQPGGDPFAGFRRPWNRYAPAKLHWPPPDDPRGMAATLARELREEMKTAIPELVLRARNADWNAVDLLKILARDDESVWIEILKSPDEQASGWALEHFKVSPTASEAFVKGLSEAYLTNREPNHGSELLLWRVHHGARGPEVIGEIRRYLAGDPFLEPAFNAASAATMLGDSGRAILVEGLFSNARMTRDACTAALLMVETNASIKVRSRDHLVHFAKPLDMELARQHVALVLLSDLNAATRSLGVRLMDEAVSRRLKQTGKTVFANQHVSLAIEALSRSSNAAFAQPLSELLRRVSQAQSPTNAIPGEDAPGGN